MIFATTTLSASELQPGDVYLWGSYPRGFETREVLGVLQHGSMGSVLLELRKPDGNVVRSTLCGNVYVIPR